MVETGSGMLDDLSRQDAPAKWEPFRQSDFVDFVNAIGIRLNNSAVWLFTEKTIDLGFQVMEMFLSPCDPEARAVEGIVFHDQTSRCNERP
jgi:hypothetical protein